MIPSFVKVQQDGDAESLSCFVKNRMGRDFLCIRRGAAKRRRFNLLPLIAAWPNTGPWERPG
jgi:hypothetical protein